MHELLPETWLREEEESRSVVGLPRRKSAHVINILQWVQCFSTLVGVLSKAHPQIVPDLMAHQATIVLDFEDLHWVQYDRMYHHQVAITKDIRWGRVDTTLYSKCFAGKENMANLSWPGSLQHSYGEQAAPAQISRPQGDQQLERWATCNLFNASEGSRCYLINPCKYQHICAECRRKHPRARCSSRGGSSKGS